MATSTLLSFIVADLSPTTLHLLQTLVVGLEGNLTAITEGGRRKSCLINQSETKHTKRHCKDPLYRKTSPKQNDRIFLHAVTFNFQWLVSVVGSLEGGAHWENVISYIWYILTWLFFGCFFVIVLCPPPIERGTLKKRCPLETNHEVWS